MNGEAQADTQHQQPLPSIGRIVHYTNLGDKDGKYPPEVQAATITGVYKMTPGSDPNGKDSLQPSNGIGDKANCYYVDLTVWYRTGYFQCKAVPFSPHPERGHWNWPPRT